EVREFDEVALAEKARDAVERDAGCRVGRRGPVVEANVAGGLLLQGGEDLVGRRLEPVEPEARAEVPPQGVARSIEVLRVAVRLEQPGVTDLVELLERHLPRRT